MPRLTPFLVYKKNDIPRFFYGTAWKRSKSAELTYAALNAGFRAIDTANQMKHYNEQGVGNGLQKFLKKRSTARSELFIQTKFTYAFGQDHRTPFDPEAPLRVQVRQSFESSLKHLGLDYIDSYILHGFFDPKRLRREDLVVWDEMVRIKNEGRIRFLGVSNASAFHLSELCKKTSSHPNFVQNRCLAWTGWDQQVRDICNKHKMQYQGFSLIRSNAPELELPLFYRLAKKYEKTIPQIVFRFCQQKNMICLTGTTKSRHMKKDMDIYNFNLSRSDMKSIENVSLSEKIAELDIA